MKRFRILATAFLCAWAVSPTPVRAQRPAAAPACDPDNGGLTLPAGFCALVVTEGTGEGARHLVVAPNGDIFMSRRPLGTRPGGIVALRDTNGDGKADVTEVFGNGNTTGIALRNGYLYYATTKSIERVKMTPGELKPAGPAEIIVGGLPGTGGHADKGITFDERGNVYVNVGLPSNACADLAPHAVAPDPCPLLEDGGGIWRFKADVVGQQYSRAARYATGMRQPLAIAWHNQTLYVVMNSRDSLDKFFPEKFTAQENADRPLEPLFDVKEGDVYGWPYCWLDAQTNTMVLAPEYGGDGKVVGRCAQYKMPVASFPAHWAPVGLVPYTGTQFPQKYQGGLFVAFHGSHDRNSGLAQTGFNVVFQPLAKGKVSGPYEVFADGFKGAKPVITRNDAVAKPNGVAQGPDGSIYVVESNKGKIWRILYKGASK
ncbi:MAG: sorbosone dehydrogenase [Acidobacteriota bacterium]